MVMQEPKVEFVPIDLSQSIIRTSDICGDWATQDPTGGGQRCVGSQRDAGNCPDWVDNIPWLDD